MSSIKSAFGKHHSLATIGLYEGLVSIFDGHMMTLDELYLTPAGIPDRFARLSNRLGHPFVPPEGTIDFFGYNFMKYLPAREMNKAFLFFKMNTQNYPRSPNAWASLGPAWARPIWRLAIARTLAMHLYARLRSSQGFPKQKQAYSRLEATRGALKAIATECAARGGPGDERCDVLMRWQREGSPERFRRKKLPFGN